MSVIAHVSGLEITSALPFSLLGRFPDIFTNIKVRLDTINWESLLELSRFLEEIVESYNLFCKVQERAKNVDLHMGFSENDPENKTLFKVNSKDARTKAHGSCSNVLFLDLKQLFGQLGTTYKPSQWENTFQGLQ